MDCRKNRRLPEFTASSPCSYRWSVSDEIASSRERTLEISMNNNVVDRTDVGNHSNSGGAWPDGEYCIMPGPSLKCPAGFKRDSVSLAVPMNFGLRELYSDKGKEVPYIQLGSFGGINLEAREYDQAYVLRLNTCCKP